MAMPASPSDSSSRQSASLTPLPPPKPTMEPRLPAPLASLVGREHEVATALAWLTAPSSSPRGTRLLTLTGPGGVGKTRLAQHVAALASTHVPGGVWYVPLGAITNPDDVLAAIGQTLQIRESTAGPFATRLRQMLAGNAALIVLDNFEHLVAAGPAVSELLVGCPELRALVTSRIRLRLSGEQELPVAPLPLANRDAAASLEETAGVASVALFVARARAVKPNFALTDANVDTIAAICRRLDGLPLAIELAAVRIAYLSPSALLARLEHRLPLLTGGARDNPARLQTMRNAIAWSAHLLTEDERVLFRRLSVFAGGVSLAAAETVAGDEEPQASLGSRPSLLDRIGSLVENNLLRVDERDRDTPRYAMLEVIREYGQEQLAASGEAETIRRRHATLLITYAEQHAPSLSRTANATELDHLAAELDNIRVALAWAIERGEAAIALELARATYQLWFLRAAPAEGRRWVEAALATDGPVPDRPRTDALLCAAALAFVTGDRARQRELAEAGLRLSRQADYRFGIGNAVFQLGVDAEWSGDLDRAAACYEAALAPMEEAGEPYWVALLLSSLGDVNIWRDDFARAEPLIDEALARWRTMGNDWGIALALGSAAVLARRQGNLELAGRLHAESFAISNALGDKRAMAGELVGAAALAEATQQAERAARLLGAASALIDHISVRHLPHHSHYETVVAAVRTYLDEQTFTAAWTVGRTSVGDDIMAEIPSAPARNEPPGADAPELTRREHDILHLLVEGDSDREIADRLSISVRTVSNHVSSILGKLGVTSRTAAASRAHRERLI